MENRSARVDDLAVLNFLSPLRFFITFEKTGRKLRFELSPLIVTFEI
jgi:hypothetical protein